LFHHLWPPTPQVEPQPMRLAQGPSSALSRSKPEIGIRCPTREDNAQRAKFEPVGRVKARDGDYALIWNRWPNGLEVRFVMTYVF
jgi:hypothetical protein